MDDRRANRRKDSARLSRRAALAAGAAAVARAALAREAASTASTPARGFDLRGYYITFMRMPTFGLAEWKRAIDCFAADHINVLILWMAGGFRSRKFPITWAYNAEHHNVRQDFARDLIRHAHSKQIKVLLGFTPFGYDGVNQFALDRPDLHAVAKDGRPTAKFGIHCWGWNLCPSRPENQRFMREYVREMWADFNPEADGLLIESSDYAICHCPDCRGRFYDREFELVSAVSAELWAAKPDSTIVVYPHYFSGARVPGMDADAARRPFDPRWSLFFTPHSAPVEPSLVARAQSSIWSDDAPALHGPTAIRAAANRARDARLSGYVPSLEAFSYVATDVEERRQDLVGKRQVPFGFGWLRPDGMPYNELPVRVNRIAFREFSQNPALTAEEFRNRLGKEVFGGEDTDPAWIDDLLRLNRTFLEGRTWCQPAPLASPERVRADLAAGRATPAALAAHRATLDEIKTMTARHANSSHPARREIHRIGQWLLDQWTPSNLRLLDGNRL
jgi:hypothetical protein